MGAIGGIIHPGVDSYAAFLDVMLRRLDHRGGGGMGTWRGEGCLLGQSRFAVGGGGDEAGRPAANEDETVWAVLSGELYNSQELRAGLIAKGHAVRGASDTEILPHLYEELGDRFVDRLHGMFALALWDAARNRIILARDRAGEKPLFYAPIPGGFAFASEMKGLFAIPGIDMTVRSQAIHDFLSFGVVPGEETVYAGIRRVPPAHMIVADADGVTFARPYWRLGFTPKLRIGRGEALEEVLRLTTDAVGRRLPSRTATGCFLSGEIDSALIAVLAAARSGNPLKTYSVRTAAPGRAEKSVAALIAEHYGTEHTELEPCPDIDEIIKIVAHFDEPFSDFSDLPTLAAARSENCGIEIALSGAGGAEIFADSDRYAATRTTQRLRHAGFELARPVFAGLTRFLRIPTAGRPAYSSFHRFVRMMAVKDGAQYLLLTGDRLNESEKARLCGAAGFRSSLRLMEGLNREFPGLGPVDSMFAKDFSRLLGESRLVELDMAGMASALRIRSPFFDHALIDFVTALPESHRPPGRNKGSLLRGLTNRVLPPVITEALLKGRKTPDRSWMTDGFQSLMRERVLDPGSYAMGNFDRSQVEALVLCGGSGWEAGRWTDTVWTLLCLEIWWDRYRGGVRVTARRSGDPSATINAAA